MLLIAAGCFAISCNSNKTKGEMTVVSKDGKEKATVDLKNAANTADELNKKTEELKKLTPLSTDELKALLPEELLGMKRTNFEAANMGGYASADATYRKYPDDKPYISVSIVDCAGNRGASYYSMMFWAKMNIIKEGDTGYTKTVDWKGGRAIERFEKDRDRYEFTYFSSDRYLVVLKGGKTGLDLVKQVAETLQFK
jgi:hypothetical protein